MSVKNIRLFVFDTKVAINQEIILNKEQSHYIAKVMRANIGESFRIFNKNNQEWLVEVRDNKKSATVIAPTKMLREQRNNPERKRIKVYFSPLKNQKLMNLMIDKIVEIGVDEIQPIITDFTNNRKINTEKLQIHTVEASEQSEQLSVPDLLTIENLTNIINNKPEKEAMFICFEKESKDNHLLKVLGEHKYNNNDIDTLSIMIGPEGGFSDKEIKLFENTVGKKGFSRVSLGNSILRAETAVIAATYLLKSYVDVETLK